MVTQNQPNKRTNLQIRRKSYKKNWPWFQLSHAYDELRTVWLDTVLLTLIEQMLEQLFNIIAHQKAAKF